jgi:hypothetical protein
VKNSTKVKSRKVFRYKDGVNFKKLGLAALSLTPTAKARDMCTLETLEGKNTFCPTYNYGDEIRVDDVRIDDMSRYNIHDLKGGFEIPAGERTFNEENVVRYLDNFKSTCSSGSCADKRDMMKIIYDTKRISFNDFLYTTYKTVQLFERIVKDDFAFLTQHDESDYNRFHSRKSNIWVGKMVYNLLDKNPTEVIYDKLSVYDTETLKDRPKYKNILYSDDMVYSGEQLPHYIDGIVARFDIEENLYLILPFISSRGIENIDWKLGLRGLSFKITVFVGEIIQSSNEATWPDSPTKHFQRDRIVFDHKLADSLSTPYWKYNFGTCPDVYRDNEAKILGGNSGDTEYVPILSLETEHKKQFFERSRKARKKHRINILNPVYVPYKDPEIVIPVSELKRIASGLTEDVKSERRQGKEIIEKINRDCKENKTYQSYLTDFSGTTCGCETFVDEVDKPVYVPKLFKLYVVN